jgi:hypothetical protein
MVPLVLALARLLGRLSTPRPEAPAVVVVAPALPENVVALVPHPQNRLDSGSRRAA